MFRQLERMVTHQLFGMICIAFLDRLDDARMVHHRLRDSVAVLDRAGADRAHVKKKLVRHLRNQLGQLMMVDNAVAYNSEGIIVGTTTLIPEPSGIAIEFMGVLAFVLFRRRHLRQPFNSCPKTSAGTMKYPSLGDVQRTAHSAWILSDVLSAERVGVQPSAAAEHIR